MARNYSLEKSAWENEAWCFIHFSTLSFCENSHQNLVTIILLLGKVLSSYAATLILESIRTKQKRKTVFLSELTEFQHRKKKGILIN